MPDPVVQRNVHKFARSEHFQKNQFRIDGVRNVMTCDLRHKTDVIRVEIHRAHSIVCKHRHTCLTADVVEPKPARNLSLSAPQLIAVHSSRPVDSQELAVPNRRLFRRSALSRKYGSSLRLIFGRAWKIRAFTAATEMPRPSAISLIERPSSSYCSRTRRAFGLSSASASLSIRHLSWRKQSCSGFNAESVTASRNDMSSDSECSSIETSTLRAFLRSFISATLIAMRDSQVENRAPPLKSRR